MIDSIVRLVEAVMAFVTANPELMTVIGELVAIIINLLRQIKSLKTGGAALMAAKPHSHVRSVVWAALPWNLFREVSH